MLCPVSLSKSNNPDTRIQLADAENCVCAKCNQYLSYPPVVIHNNKHYHEECCNVPTDSGEVFPALEYEALAKYLKFPCINKSEGCLKYFLFGVATKEHLQNCPYMQLPCPFNVNGTCDWKGTTPKLPIHFHTNHPDNYLDKPKFKVEYDNTGIECYLMDVDGILVVIKSKCDLKANTLCLTAVKLPSILNVTFATYSVKLVPWCPAPQSMEFKTTTLASTFDNTLIEHWTDPVNVDFVVKFLDTPHIECIFTFDINIDINVIKCPECCVYMIPPIFRCRKNHVICTDCRLSSQTLPDSCKPPLTRAFDLEQVSRSVSIPCRYSMCRKNCDNEDIRNHESQCKIAREALVCTLCGLQIVASPLVCYMNHAFCRTCASLSEDCYKCGRQLKNHLELESILKVITFKCQWASCKAILRPSNMKNHECEYSAFFACKVCKTRCIRKFYCGNCNMYECITCNIYQRNTVCIRCHNKFELVIEYRYVQVSATQPN